MERLLRVAAWLGACLFILVGVGELLLADGTLGHRVTFAVVLGVFAALVVLGVGMIETRPWVGAAMASVGAVAGGLALFWTIAAVLLAIVIVILSVMCARRAAAPSIQPA
jgi:hypothetical protein